MNGTLYVVATPIGNLEDLTPRARQTLAAVDLIAAEDTRHTGRLLSHIGCKTPQMALHEHNEDRVTPLLIERLKSGNSVALVSDAGTPLLSDPGFALVRSAHRNRIPVSPVPGACALIAGLSVAGLPTDRFCFEGFLPSKPKARRARLEELAAEGRTIVCYESVHRIAATIADLVQCFGGERPAFIGRELTKLHEQCVASPLAELAGQLDEQRIEPRGEFVIVIGGGDRQNALSADVDRLLLEFAAELPARRAAAIAARVTGHRRNELYRRLLELASAR